MEQNESRRIFLNIKSILEHEKGISNIDVQADDNFYSMSCCICNGNRLAFGIKKTGGISFAKASVKTAGLKDDRIMEMCDELIDDNTQVTYSINASKTVFQIVTPLQNAGYEDNNRTVYSEFKIFTSIVTAFCQRLGYGDVIDIEYREYEKKGQQKISNEDLRAEAKPEQETASELAGENADNHMSVMPDIKTRDTGETPMENGSMPKMDDIPDIPDISDIPDMPDMQDMMMGMMKVDDFGGIQDNDMSGVVSVDDFDGDAEDSRSHGKILSVSEMTDIPVDEYDVSEPKQEEEYSGIVRDAGTDKDNVEERRDAEKKDSSYKDRIKMDNKDAKDIGRNGDGEKGGKDIHNRMEADNISINKESPKDIKPKFKPERERKGMEKPSGGRQDIGDMKKDMDLDSPKAETDIADEIGDAVADMSVMPNNAEAEQKQARDIHISKERERNRKKEEDTGRERMVAKEPEADSRHPQNPAEKPSYDKKTYADSSSGRKEDDEPQNKAQQVEQQAISDKTDSDRAETSNKNTKDNTGNSKWSKGGDNRKKEGDRKMEEKKNSQYQGQRANIFVNYDRDIRNIENRYKNQIRNLPFEELVAMIENRHGQLYDNNGNVADVADYIRESLCSIAKAELKNRMK